MDNNVISALQRTLADWGWATMRFNFQGVGGSGGEYGNGQGEVRDLLAVAAYLKGKGKEALHVAGYSFGAWIGLKAIVQGFEPASAIFVSPPLDFLDFSSLVLPQTHCLITLGDRDSFCSLQTLHTWLAAQKANRATVDLETLSGCDHFYWNHEPLLSAKVSEFLKKHFQPPA